MPRKKNYLDLYVFMNGIRVGILSREANGTLIFTYDKDWLVWHGTRPISLSMPLSEMPYKGYVVKNFFDNLLPDSDLIRKRIQARFNLASDNCFDLLSSIGSDCIGALQLMTQEKVNNIKTIQGYPISDKDIAKLLKHYQTAPLGMDRETNFRISIAGAQEKTALLWHQEKWFLPKGATPTNRIIKLPIGKIQHSNIDLSESVENEWLCLKILAAYNLPVNYAQIINFNEVKTLVVDRFDRRWAKNEKWLMRLPQEDFCQAIGMPPGLKYESDGGPGIEAIMKVLLGSEKTLDDRELFMKSVFLFWVMGAIDGHAKNFSINIEPQGRFHLTPLYDVISAYPLAVKRQVEWHELKMAMGLKRKNKHYLWGNIQIHHWISMATTCHFATTLMQNIIDEVFDNMESIIKQVKDTLPENFPKHISQPIFEGMRKIKNKKGK